MQKFGFAAGLGLASAGSGSVHLREDFSEGWRERWVDSEWKKEEGTAGKWETSAGKNFGDETRDTGLKTGEDSKFFGISTEFTPFSNKGKDLVIQYQMKHEQSIECGGGYIKVGPKPEDLTKFGDPTEYNVMFGPDQCGGTNRIHVILNYKGKNHLKKTDVVFHPVVGRSHLLTLHIKPDSSYEVLVDMESKHKGELKEDFDFLEPKEIKDPKESKPADWVDEAMIDDPEETKPEDWVTEKRITDPKAEQPEDWDEEEDGEWEAPTIDNPDYKGDWSAKRIDNPAYKGPWEHPMVENPDFAEDKEIYSYENIGFAGFDLWQVKGGTIFDNIFMSDSLEEANTYAESTWKLLSAAEKKGEEEAAAKPRRKLRKPSPRRRPTSTRSSMMTLMMMRTFKSEDVHTPHAQSSQECLSSNLKSVNQNLRETNSDIKTKIPSSPEIIAYKLYELTMNSKIYKI